MKLTAAGRRQEVGLTTETLNATVRRSLNVPLDKDRLSQNDKEELDEVRRTHETDDVTPMNAKYGPISGMSEGERLLRAYRLGLLVRREGVTPQPPLPQQPPPPRT